MNDTITKDKISKYYENFNANRGDLPPCTAGMWAPAILNYWPVRRIRTRPFASIPPPPRPLPPTPTPRAICVKKSRTRLSALAQKEVGKVAVEEGGQTRHSQDQQRRGNLKRQNLIIPSCVYVPVQGSDFKERCLIKLSFLNLRKIGPLDGSPYFSFMHCNNKIYK